MRREKMKETKVKKRYTEGERGREGGREKRKRKRSGGRERFFSS